jgi:hypothetical protein
MADNDGLNIIPAPTGAEIAEWDANVQNSLDKLRDRKGEAERLASDGVRFLAVSEQKLSAVTNQGFFGRLWGGITGKSGQNRDMSQRNLQMAQKATLQLLQKLGEQNVLQMDAITSLGSMVNYLHFSNTELKDKIANLFESHQSRLQNLEEEFNLLKEISYWAQGLKGRKSIRKLKSKALRLVAFSQSAAEIAVPGWQTREVDIFNSGLEDVGFQFEESVTVREFFVELLEEADNDFFQTYVLPLVESALALESGSSLPCHYALAEAHELRATSARYEIVQVATEMANQQGASLTANGIMQQTLFRYLEGRGVDLDTPVEYAQLGLELMLGARIYRQKVAVAAADLGDEGSAGEVSREVNPVPPIPAGMVRVGLPDGETVLYVDRERSTVATTFAEATKALQAHGKRLPSVHEAMLLSSTFVADRLSLIRVKSGRRGEDRSEWTSTNAPDSETSALVMAAAGPDNRYEIKEGSSSLWEYEFQPYRKGYKAHYRGVIVGNQAGTVIGQMDSAIGCGRDTLGGLIEVPPGMAEVVFPSGTRLLVDVEATRVGKEEEVVQALSARGARLPTVEEMSYLISSRDETGLKVSCHVGRYQELVETDRSAYSGPRVVRCTWTWNDDGEVLGEGMWDDERVIFTATVLEDWEGLHYRAVIPTKG